MHSRLAEALRRREAQYRHRDAPREIEVTLVKSTLTDWDELFVANVARDGILLWARGATVPAGAAAALPNAWRHLAAGTIERMRR